MNLVTVVLGLAWIVLWAGTIGLMIYGLILAFSASFWVGVLALILEPSPLILGILALAGHADIAHRVAGFLGL